MDSENKKKKNTYVSYSNYILSLSDKEYIKLNGSLDK